MLKQVETQAGTEHLQEFATFYKEQLNPLTWSLIRAGATPAEAEDVAQEAMHLALQRWPEIKKPHGFVRTVARRIVRRRWDETKRDLRAHHRIAQDESFAAFDANQDLDKVMTMLKTLPDAQREAFAWHTDGYTPTEIAEITGQKPGTVRSNIRHARTKLIALLDTAPTKKGADNGP